MHKKITSILLGCLLVASMFAFTGCNLLSQLQPQSKAVDSSESVVSSGKENANSTDKAASEEDVIVAGTIDTSSQFSFSVENALIGISYSDKVIVVLVGTFTNNSDEAVSFSWALDTMATQNGYTLSSSYISGSNKYNYNEIAPGKTIETLIAWEILDAENDITLTVIDRQHYAKEEIFSKTFTIDELIENTLNFHNSDEIFEEEL